MFIVYTIGFPLVNYFFLLVIVPLLQGLGANVTTGTQVHPATSGEPSEGEPRLEPA